MAKLDHLLARRAIVKAAGLGLVATGLTQAMSTQVATAAAAEGGEIWSSEYWAKKGDIPLWMYRKRLGAPKADEPSRPVLFFVHGSSISSRVFDLRVPGHGEYSVMDEFARYGFDCWTMDHENYGKSGRTSGNSDIASGVEDLKAAAAIVSRETGRQKFHFLANPPVRCAPALTPWWRRSGPIDWCSPPLPIRARGPQHSPSAPSSWPISARTTCASAIAT